MGTWDMSLGTKFKAHYGLFSLFSMWLVFDFSMTDRHCCSKGNFTDGRLGSSAVVQWLTLAHGHCRTAEHRCRRRAVVMERAR